MLRRHVLFLLLIAAAMALIGCGGGGGLGSILTAGNTAGQTNGDNGLQLRYTTNWSAGSQSPTGQSQRVRLFDMSGDQVAQRVVNTASSSQQITFNDVPQGFYIVRSELFSDINAGGEVVGLLETQVQGEAQISTAVGAAIANLRVTPETAVLNLSETKHFSVAGLSSDNQLVFLAPGSITWSETGNALTIDQNGDATAAAAGTGRVVATHTGGKSDSSEVTVAGPNGHTQWTVLLYLNASNDLFPFAAPDMNELERVATNPQVRFVVQWKQVQGVGGNNNPLFSGTRRYQIQHDTTNAIGSQVVQELGVNTDMGRAATLSDFINWGKQNYPAERYCVIVWNHGNGWLRGKNDRAIVKGVSYDDHTGNAIQTWQLRQALQGQHLDIFSFDACLMQMLEVMSEVQGLADYVVASEENTPGYGYPYHVVFQPWMDNPGASTRDLTKSFVDGHTGFPDYQNDVITQSSVEASKIGAVESAVDALAGALIDNRAALTTIVPNIRNASMKYAFRGDGRNYYDLWDIANRLQKSDAPAAVKNAAATVKTAVAAAVAWNGFTPLSAGSHGISIDFSPKSSFQNHLLDYSLLKLAQDTRWDEWLTVAP